MKNYLLLLAVAATVSLASCGKDDDEATTPAKTKTDLLTASTWKLTSIGLDTNNDGTVDSDLTPFVSACSKDDVLTFKTDKTFSYDEGASKCDPADPQVYDSGNWAFTTNDTKISLTRPNSTEVSNYSVMELTESTLKYSETIADSTGNFNVIATLSH